MALPRPPSDQMEVGDAAHHPYFTFQTDHATE